MSETQFPPSAGQKSATTQIKSTSDRSGQGADARPAPSETPDQNGREVTVRQRGRIVHIPEQARDENNQPVQLKGEVTASDPQRQEVTIQTEKGEVTVKLPDPPPTGTQVTITVAPTPDVEAEIAEHIRHRTTVTVEYKIRVTEAELAKEAAQASQSLSSTQAPTAPATDVPLREGDVVEARFVYPEAYYNTPQISEQTPENNKPVEQQPPPISALPPVEGAQPPPTQIVEGEDPDIVLARILQSGFQAKVTAEYTQGHRPDLTSSSSTSLRGASETSRGGAFSTLSVEALNVLAQVSQTIQAGDVPPNQGTVKADVSQNQSQSSSQPQSQIGAAQSSVKSDVITALQTILAHDGLGGNDAVVANALANIGDSTDIQPILNELTAFLKDSPAMGISAPLKEIPRTYTQTVQIQNIIPPASDIEGEGKPVSIQTPQQTPQQSQPQSQQATQNNQNTITGMVTGQTPTGSPIVSSFENVPIILQTTQSIPVGSQIVLGIMPQTVMGVPVAPDATTVPVAGSGSSSPLSFNPLNAVAGFNPLSSLTWPALEDSLQVLQNTAPVAAQNLQNSLPTPTPRLVPTALFFLVALKMGNIESWLGNKTLDSLRDAGRRDLVERLGRDFGRIARQATELVAGDWRAISMPMLQEDQQITNLQFFVRHQTDPDGDQAGDAEDQKNSGKQTRFILNLDLSRLGKMQIDGLLKAGMKKLDVVVRTQDGLSAEARQQIRQKFTQGLEEVQLDGTLSFQAHKEGWVDIDTSDRTGGKSGHHVTA